MGTSRKKINHLLTGDYTFFPFLVRSLSLCFEDINLQDNEELIFILKIVNMVFAVLFFIEMLLKWVAFGLFRWVTKDKLKLGTIRAFCLTTG